jgi:hypothetical protein
VNQKAFIIKLRPSRSTKPLDVATHSSGCIRRQEIRFQSIGCAGRQWGVNADASGHLHYARASLCLSLGGRKKASGVVIWKELNHVSRWDETLNVSGAPRESKAETKAAARLNWVRIIWFANGKCNGTIYALYLLSRPPHSALVSFHVCVWRKCRERGRGPAAVERRRKGEHCKLMNGINEHGCTLEMPLMNPTMAWGGWISYKSRGGPTRAAQREAMRYNVRVHCRCTRRLCIFDMHTGNWLWESFPWCVKPTTRTFILIVAYSFLWCCMPFAVVATFRSVSKTDAVKAFSRWQWVECLRRDAFLIVHLIFIFRALKAFVIFHILYGITISKIRLVFSHLKFVAIFAVSYDRSN